MVFYTCIVIRHLIAPWKIDVTIMDSPCNFPSLANLGNEPLQLEKDVWVKMGCLPNLMVSTLLAFAIPALDRARGHKIESVLPI